MLAYCKEKFTQIISKFTPKPNLSYDPKTGFNVTHANGVVTYKYDDPSYYETYIDDSRKQIGVMTVEEFHGREARLREIEKYGSKYSECKRVRVIQITPDNTVGLIDNGLLEFTHEKCTTISDTYYMIRPPTKSCFDCRHCDGKCIKVYQWDDQYGCDNYKFYAGQVIHDINCEPGAICGSKPFYWYNKPNPIKNYQYGVTVIAVKHSCDVKRGHDLRQRNTDKKDIGFGKEINATMDDVIKIANHFYAINHASYELPYSYFNKFDYDFGLDFGISDTKQFCRQTHDNCDEKGYSGRVIACGTIGRDYEKNWECRENATWFMVGPTDVYCTLTSVYDSDSNSYLKSLCCKGDIVKYDGAGPFVIPGIDNLFTVRWCEYDHSAECKTSHNELLFKLFGVKIKSQYRIVKHSVCHDDTTTLTYSDLIGTEVGIASSDVTHLNAYVKKSTTE
jgi:hypothetical protein